MPVVIGEIVTEVVTAPQPGQGAPVPQAGSLDDTVIETIVRRSVERVLETLRREWDR